MPTTGELASTPFLKGKGAEAERQREWAGGILEQQGQETERPERMWQGKPTWGGGGSFPLNLPNFVLLSSTPDQPPEDQLIWVVFNMMTTIDLLPSSNMRLTLLWTHIARQTVGGELSHLGTWRFWVCQDQITSSNTWRPVSWVLGSPAPPSSSPPLPLPPRLKLLM